MNGFLCDENSTCDRRSRYVCLPSPQTISIKPSQPASSTKTTGENITAFHRRTNVAFIVRRRGDFFDDKIHKSSDTYLPACLGYTHTIIA
jgi:hypothetical protein